MKVLPAALTLVLAVFAGTGAHAEKYELLAQRDFLAAAFPGARPQSGKFEIPAALATRLAAVLSHPYAEIRVRYWRAGARTAWVLDEVGKEEPITAGVVVDQGKIVSIAVLTYREGHGMEVAEPEFTRQFAGTGINTQDTLDHDIDGITGATLSVKSMTRMARAALVLDAWLQAQGDNGK